VIDTPSWLALAAIASGVISVGFLWYLWPYRNRLGGRFFIATIGCEAVWALAYGVALLAFDPALRRVFEVPIWAAINFIGVFFLAFALEYTGRSEVLRSKLFAGIVGLQVIHTLVVATNPIHGIAWSGYRIEPVFGAATVTYAHHPWLFVNAAGFILLIAVASILLADTVFSYGPLYRTQAAAIAISPIFPGLPFLLWLAEVGATPPLNLTPLLFPVHLAFDMYAFFSRDMFEMVPAARRIADRAAIDNLGTAVAIVDSGGRIIEHNHEAARVLGLPAGGALGGTLAEHAPDLDPESSGGTVSRTIDGERRQYTVTTSALTDAAGTAVGTTIVLQDVTAERRREQRLAVLNRVLRHNLRNDLNVVQGYLDVATDRVDDADLRRMLGIASRKTEGVIELGEKARSIEQAMGEESGGSTTVAVAELLDDVGGELTADRPGTVGIEVPADLSVRANASVLAAVFRNLIENALEHGSASGRTGSGDGPGRGGGTDVGAAPGDDGVGTESGDVDPGSEPGDADPGAEPGDADPTVTVRLAARDADGVVFEVIDGGPGIPEHEREVLDATEETALEHGSGLGLWIVKWGVVSLGGSVAFDVTDAGTTVRLRLPNTGEADGSESATGTERSDSTAGAEGDPGAATDPPPARDNP